jgi:hypothetical protein
MAEATQYTFSWAEVAELLIRKQDIHEGDWTAAVEFVVTAAVVGPTPTDAKPGLMVMSNSVQLVRTQPNTPPHLVVDAAKVNPKS